MSIQYTYTVKAVNAELKTMEVEYTADGYSTKLIGMPLPIQGQTLEQVVTQYAPMAAWVSETTPVVAVQVGESGSVQPTAPAPVEPAAPAAAVPSVITVGKVVL